MTASIIIPIAIWQARRARIEQEKRDQALIEAVEAELDLQPIMDRGELIKRAQARIEQESTR